MKKISTLYKKDEKNFHRVIDELNEKNSWVLNGEGIPTRKFDGTAAAIINGEIYKRYDVKNGQPIPDGAIFIQERDPVTGHQPFWLKCSRNEPSDKYFFEAFDQLENKEDATYELCGEKIQGNPEHLNGSVLIKHGSVIIPITDFSFEGLKKYLGDSNNDIEGIVFHHKDPKDGRMCKIKKRDFGFKR